jgi:hypothetical protein
MDVVKAPIMEVAVNDKEVRMSVTMRASRLAGRDLNEDLIWMILSGPSTAACPS